MSLIFLLLVLRALPSTNLGLIYNCSPLVQKLCLLSEISNTRCLRIFFNWMPLCSSLPYLHSNNRNSDIRTGSSNILTRWTPLRYFWRPGNFISWLHGEILCEHCASTLFVSYLWGWCVYMFVGGRLNVALRVFQTRRTEGNFRFPRPC
jgi:hypothetical protein